MEVCINSCIAIIVLASTVALIASLGMALYAMYQKVFK